MQAALSRPPRAPLQFRPARPVGTSLVGSAVCFCTYIHNVLLIDLARPNFRRTYRSCRACVYAHPPLGKSQARAHNNGRALGRRTDGRTDGTSWIRWRNYISFETHALAVPSTYSRVRAMNSIRGRPRGYRRFHWSARLICTAGVAS